MAVVSELISYGGWDNCLRLKNGLIEVIMPLQVGIRILNFAFSDSPNVFAEFHEQLGLSGGDVWRVYGGHRLWHAPETRARTYSLDNSPVKLLYGFDYFRLTQDVDHAGIQKEIDVYLDNDKAEVVVVHRLTNKGIWDVTCAPWALSVMAAGGKAIIPLPPRGSHETDLLPNTRLILWSYTDMADDRWTWGKEYVMLRQDPQAETPQKFGIHNTRAWAAYWRNGTLFVKKVIHQPHATYPDYDSSFEFFTNNQMLEVETLAPTVTLAPNQSVEHAETWQLFRDVPEPHTEADIKTIIEPLVK
jgi:hypothetical protein